MSEKKDATAVAAAAVENDNDDGSDHTGAESKTKLVGRPLQVVTVSSLEGEAPLQLDEAALDELAASLERVKRAHGEIPLVVQSCAGAFREGKSFILDCFLRYLHHLESTSPEDLLLEGAEESSFLENCNILEPLPDGSVMFESRSSTDRVTSGIWLYSRPFVIRNADGEKVAVLLMDTQGLLDTAASSDLDAPIFALSLLLSSKQIINKRAQFNTQDWQLLNLFSEFSMEIVRRLHRGKDPELLGEKPFQHLQFLARDFQAFELDPEDEGVTMNSFLAHCTEASNQYLDRMMAQMAKHHSKVSERITCLYQQISCACLSHPGAKMVNKRWNGDSNILEKTFRHLVARYCRDSFKHPAPKVDILGNHMEFTDFIMWVREFTTCMINALESGALPSVDEVVRVVTQHQLSNLQDESISLMKKEFAAASNDGQRHIPDSKLESIVAVVRRKSIESFEDSAHFGPQEEIAASIEQLEEKLAEVERSFRDRNKLAMARILVFFAPWATFAVLFYFLDWISDWVCDSWLSICVTASSIMAFYYTIVFVSILAFCAMKYKDYGPQGLWTAASPLFAEIAANFEKAIAKAKSILGIKDKAANAGATADVTGGGSKESKKNR